MTDDTTKAFKGVKGFPIVLSAPSGTGKTTIGRALVEGSDRFVFSISATTRAPREGERDGADYHFVGEAAFREMVARGELAEWAEVHGRLYGTPRAQLEQASGRGEFPVLDIDVQGAAQIRGAVPEARLFFIFPPSVDVMLRRLSERGTEAVEEVHRRLRSARGEIRQALDFDHVVVNDDLDAVILRVRDLTESRSGPTLDRVWVGEEIERLQAGIDAVLAGDRLK